MARTGLSPQGALLIRPDGFIAWRVRAAERDPRTVLGSVLDRVLFREGLDQA